MKLLALEIEKPGITPGEFQPHLQDEVLHVWNFYQNDIIREIYFRADQHTAVLVLECSGVDEARQVLDSLPLVQKGLIRFEIMPLMPYTGFSRLFADKL